jgi:hypothetical protein
MATLNSKKINTAIAVISGVSALLSIAMYFERKKDRKIQSEIMLLDKNIKEQQLNKLI